MKIKISILLLISLLFISCNNDEPQASLKGRTFKASYENSKFVYCITFDTNTMGRWFRLNKGSSYTLDEESIYNFNYSYNYPSLIIENLGENTMLQHQNTFLSPDTFSDTSGKYIWSEIILNELLSNNNSEGNNEDHVTRGHLSVSPKSINIGASAGRCSISVISNTSWSVFVNSGGSVNGLSISTSSGFGNGVVTVSYDAVTSQYYQQNTPIVFYYNYSEDIRLSETVTIHRRNLPR